MNYAILSIATVMFAAQSVIIKRYNILNAERKSAVPLYQLLFFAACCIFYAVYSVADFSFDIAVLPYAAGFAFCFFTAVFSMAAALKTGPVSLTSLFVQCSITLTVLYGFIFWGEQVTPMAVAGLVLFLITMGFCLLGGGRKGEKEEGGAAKISKKWLAFALVMTAANAACLIIQKTQQLVFDGQYKNMFMLAAVFFSVLIAAVYFLISNKEGTAVMVKRCSYFPIAAGICNSCVNLFLMILATRLKSGVVYPVVGIGSLVILLFMSKLLFKEKITLPQWAGMGVGFISIVLLSV